MTDDISDCPHSRSPVYCTECAGPFSHAVLKEKEKFLRSIAAGQRVEQGWGSGAVEAARVHAVPVIDGLRAALAQEKRAHATARLKLGDYPNRERLLREADALEKGAP